MDSQSVFFVLGGEKKKTNRLMIRPDRRAPTALPATAGNKCAPAKDADAFSVIWK